MARRHVVLVVEDDPSVRTYYMSALTAAGYDVIEAADGVEALERVEAVRPGAVILDLNLPGMGGREVARELSTKHHLRDIPCVIVTGDDTSDLNASDFSSILQKPVRLDDLLNAVKDCFATRE